MAIYRETSIYKYVCASGDSKPTTGVPVGSIAYETDTKDTYIYNGSSWVKKPDINEAVTDIGTIDVDTGNIDTSLNNIEADTAVLEKAVTAVATRATGSAAVATTVAPGAAFRLEEVRIHLSAAGGAGNLTVTLDSGTAAAYDAVLLTQDMTSVTDFVWKPTRPLEFTSASDEIDVAWANSNTRTYGLEIFHTLV